MKHYIDRKFPEELKDLNFKDKKETPNSLDTSTTDNENEFNKAMPSYNIPVLNLHSIKKFNYDSECENYENMEDKLKKIKERFKHISREISR